MNLDTLTLLRLIAGRDDQTKDELREACGFAEVNARLGTLQAHGYISAQHRPGRGGKASYSATPKAARLLKSLEKPAGDVAGPRIPFPKERYNPAPWVAPRELARMGVVR